MAGTVLVVGGAGGLGLAVSRLLSQEGWTVYATSRTPETRAAVLNAHAPEARLLGWTPGEPPARVVAEVTRREGGLYGLVYMPGPLGPRQPLRSLSQDVWRKVWEENLDRVMEFVQAALPPMRSGGGGRVVALTAVGAGQAAGWSGHGAYAAAKAALVALVRSLALEEEPFGITANLVAPSRIRASDKAGLTPRAGRPDGQDVAEAVAFLLKPAERSVTGQVIELSFGIGIGLRPGQTTLPVTARMEPVGKTVQPRMWQDRHLTGTIIDRRLEADGAWYQVAGSEETVWVHQNELAGEPDVP